MDVTATNPYDFIHPVTRPEEFAGRAEQLRDVDYYLDLARSDSPTFMNLALIGDRASGKTSLLHMVEHRAVERGLLPVRIALNEDTSTSDVLFFKELLDGIMTAGAKAGMYGGIGAKIYRNFRRMLDTLDIEAEVPLLFGTVYIGKKTRDADAKVPQHVMIADLEELRKEGAKIGIYAIVVLLDECDLLSNSRVLLQKIRNIFSEVQGYVLVFSGTEAMFPEISDVFSPVPRLFKRINVGSFQTVDEVVECILKPLPMEGQAKVHPTMGAEVFRLTGGNPYEVKLVSHFTYKRYRNSGAPLMMLSAGVLDDVFQELDRFRTPAHAKLLDEIRRCTPPELMALLAVLEFGQATLAHIVSYRLLDDLEGVSIERVKRAGGELGGIMAILREKGLIAAEDGGMLRFLGDDFDVLYLKYYSAAKGIPFSSFVGSEVPTGPILHKLEQVLFGTIQSYRINVRFDRTAEQPHQLFTVGGKFQLPPGRTEVSLGSPEEWERAFFLDEENGLRFRVDIPVLGQGMLYKLSFDTVEHKERAVERVHSVAANLSLAGFNINFEDEVSSYNAGILKLKAGDHSGAVELFDRSVQTNPGLELAWAQRGMALRSLGEAEEAVVSFDRALAILPRWPVVLARKGDVLVELGRVAEATACYDHALSLDPMNADALIGKGHTFSVIGDHREALRWYEQARTAAEMNPLAWSNRSNALLNLGDLGQALTSAEKALELDPGHRLAAVNKALVLDRLGDPAAALVWAEKAMALYPSEGVLWLVAASAHLDLGNLEDALSRAHTAVERGADQPGAWMLLGEIQLRSGLRTEAVDSLRRAVKLAPGLRDLLKRDPFDQVHDEV